MSVLSRRLLVTAVVTATMFVVVPPAGALAGPAPAGGAAVALLAGPGDAFGPGAVVLNGGARYVTYHRTHAGLPVLGGDAVVVIDAAGTVVSAASALARPIGALATAPALDRPAAEVVARRQLTEVARVEHTRLVVDAAGAGPAALAWESTVDGVGPRGPSRLTVVVDATTGAVRRTQEHVQHGSGTSQWNGPNPIALATTHVGTTYRLQDPVVTNLTCRNAATNVTFSGPDDLWGNGNATNRETGCVDALFATQTANRMLSVWLGRNATNGAGGSVPLRVGLNDIDIYTDGTQIQIGHNSAGQWLGSLDLMGHEIGHLVDQSTGPLVSSPETTEFIGDAFGASTEYFANEPAPYDTRDFLIGEAANPVGTGAVSNMYDPAALGAAPCYTASIPQQSSDPGFTAGVGNHWFYLLAEGSKPTDGQPPSKTCNGSTVVGQGVPTALRVLYSALLSRTGAAPYLKLRTLTLAAAKALTPGNCALFTVVKGAWNAVSVPAQVTDPVC